MINKIRLFILIMISTLFIFTGASMTSVQADTTPTLQFSFKPDAIKQEYILGDTAIFLLLDNTSYTVSADVTQVDFVLKDPTDSPIPNTSEIPDTYYFDFSVVGTHTLEIHIANDTDSDIIYYNIYIIKEFDTSTLGTPIDITEMSDSNLYNALLSVFQQIYKTEYGQFCNITGLYTDMFMSISSTTLDISGKEINSLHGMQYLNFNNLETLIASNNKLTSIPEGFLDDEYVTLKNLDVSNNLLTDLQIKNLVNLENINLANNKLESVDVSHINIGTKQAYINLAYNKLRDYKNITIPKGENKYSKISLNLISNYLGAPIEDFTTDTRISLTLGLQFVAQKYDYEDPNKPEEIRVYHTDTIYYYKTNTPTLKLKIINLTSDQDGSPVETVVHTIDEDTMTTDSVTLSLPCGTYKYRYYLGEEEAYSNTNERRIYLSDTFYSVPKIPTYYIEYKGQKYESIGKVTGYVTIKLNPYVAEGENIKLYYQLNGGEWIEGNTVTVQGGTDSIYIKAVASTGTESDSKLIFIQTSLNPVVPDFVLLLVVIFLLIMVVFVLVPLLGKWVNKDK